MNHDPALGALLAALRAAGLRVGVGEVERLRCVFARLGHDDAGALDEARLRALVAAVVVKSRRERETFDGLFDAWLARARAEVERVDGEALGDGVVHELPVALGSSDPQGVAAQRGVRPRLRFVVRLVASVVALLLVQRADEGPAPPERVPSPTPIATPSALPRASAALPPATPTPKSTPAPRLSPRERTFEAIVPVLHVVPARVQWTGWPWLALALTSFVAALGLGISQRRRRRWPRPAPAARLEGPARVLLPAAQSTRPELLLPADRERLVWGVGHFVSDERTRRLDLPATVRATARHAGLIQPRFEGARQAHEVWLWLDEASADSALERLAEEVQHLLRAHGLPVERARFFELPSRLIDADGRAFAPAEVEDRREAALVALLTDGGGLRRELESGARRVQTTALLGQLSRWPHLALVDFSSRGDLRALLARHGIEIDVLAPADLAAFLGAERGERTRAAPLNDALAGEAALWAGACALCPSEVPEEAALRLRRALGLRASPWELRALRAQAGVYAERLRWDGARRATLINRLHAAEVSASPLAPDGLLARALDFWLAEYAAEDERQVRAGRPWRDTPAEHRWRVERALLRLWREPAEAARELFALHQGALRDVIRRALGQHAPADCAVTTHIRLPWTWASLGATERALLQEMGLGGALPKVRLRPPGRVVAGLAALLALAALGGVRAWQAPPMPLVRQVNGMPEDGMWMAPFLTGSAWRTEASTRRFRTAIELVFSGADLEWRRETRRCVETTTLAGGGSVEAWRCGHSAVLPARLKDIERSVAVLLDPPTLAEGEAMAMALLDGGTADLVWIGRGAGKQAALEELRQSVVGLNTQWLVVATSSTTPEPSGLQPVLGDAPGALRTAWVSADDWLALRARLPIEGEAPLEQVWPGVQVVSSGRPVRLTGERRVQPVPFETVTLDRTGTVVSRRPGAARAFTEDLGNDVGLDMVLVPGGSFMMGSPSTEESRIGWEGPQHGVNVPAFALGRYEITQAQWRAVAGWLQVRIALNPDPSRFKGSARPVDSVSWDDAQEFCARLTARTGRAYRLPSEAEWEYAARAGTTTPFAFGATITPDLVNYYGAWPYADAAPGIVRSSTVDVGSLRIANAFGLFDMHGNVWEWVQDPWHDDYTGAPSDGRAWEGGDANRRVARGGSWILVANGCRSAYRARYAPGNHSHDLGFRVCCSCRGLPDGVRSAPVPSAAR